MYCGSTERPTAEVTTDRICMYEIDWYRINDVDLCLEVV